MRYRHVETLVGRGAIVAARIERSWLWYRVSAILVTGTVSEGDVRGQPIASYYLFTRASADRLAHRVLGKR